MNKYIKGAQLDAQMIIAEVGGYSLDHYPLWHVDTDGSKTPTYRAAKLIAERAGVKIERKEVHRSRVTPDPNRLNGYTEITRVVVWVTGNTCTTAGYSRDPLFAEEIATGLAFRAAVEYLL